MNDTGQLDSTATNRVALALEGDVLVTAFGEAVLNVGKLLTALSQQVGEPKLRWKRVLEGGIFSALGEGPSAAVAAVVRAYGEIAAALSENKPLPGNSAVASAVAELVAMNEPGVHKIRFITPTGEWVTPPRKIANASDPQSAQRSHPDRDERSRGARPPVLDVLRGRVQTISSRRGLRLVIYDSIFDRPVVCRFDPGQEELAHKLWRKYVRIVGDVRRNERTGRAVEISQVREVVELVAEPGAWLRTLANLAKVKKRSKRGRP